MPSIVITKIEVYVQKYGQDVIVFHTEYPEPLATAEPGSMLGLVGRATRMQGERWARETFPGIPVEAFNYHTGRLKHGTE